MNPLQKVIKYFAMAFAVALTIMIFTGVFGIITGVSAGFSNTIITGFPLGERNTEVVSYKKEFQDVKSIDVESGSYSVTIQTGDRFLVEAENVSENYKAIRTSNGTLSIGFENKNNWIFQLFSLVVENQPKARVLITVPEDFIANKVRVDGGSGSLSLNNLHAKELRLDLGSGGLNTKDLVADEVYIDCGSGDVQFDRVDLSEVVIDGGSGSLTMKEANLYNLDLDAGSGAINIHGYLSGDNSIDGGSGSMTLVILDTIDNYNINVETGSGGLWIAGEKVGDDYTRNNITANHSIHIDGGSGRVALEFQ